MPAATTSETLALTASHVAVHPLVLLSAVDAYSRAGIGASSRRRVVGVLLGQVTGAGSVNVANSFAVPFEEDERNPDVWFLDHNFIESMMTMMKKINAKEKMVGWYHTGPKLRGSDMQINELFKRYIPTPLLVVIDVKPKAIGIPTDAYYAIEEIRDDGSATSRTFVHVPSSIEAEESEEIGVEHLLRDIRDQTVGTLSTRLTQQLRSLEGLGQRLKEIADYLDKVCRGELPLSHPIISNLQDIFNLLPNLKDVAGVVPDASTAATAPPSTRADGSRSELQQAFTVKSNDQMMAIYISSIVRTVIALHDLIDNKIQYRSRAEPTTPPANGTAVNGKSDKQSV